LLSTISLRSAKPVIGVGSGRRRDARHFIGLDVSPKEGATCVVDENGVIIREGAVISEPKRSPAGSGRPASRWHGLGLR
jgi:hypothetical protein